MRGGGGDSFDGDDKNRVRRRANERRESRTQNILGKGVLAAFFLLFFWILKTNKSTSTFQVTTPAMAITYRPYTRTVDGEKELHEIKDLVSKDLSEPYSLYVFIYFIYKNPDLCIMVSTTVAPLQL